MFAHQELIGFAASAPPTYATLNPSDKTAGMTLSGGNLVATGASGWNEVRATIGKSSGKWYCEVTVTGITGGAGAEAFIVGIRSTTGSLSTTVFWYSGSWSTGTHGYNYGIQDNNYKVSNGVQTAFTNNIAVSDILGLAMDLDAGTLTAYRNNVSLGTVYSGLSAQTYTFACDLNGASTVATFNFGATAFTYTPPAGYSALANY